eukprot:14286-Hanusia_phi.AAC.1
MRRAAAGTQPVRRTLAPARAAAPPRPGPGPAAARVTPPGRRLGVTQSAGVTPARPPPARRTPRRGLGLGNSS